MIRSVRPLCFAAALLPASFAFAQQPATKPVAGSQQPATAPTDQTVQRASDAILANMVHTSCANHAALAGIALQTSQNAEVRAFARQMIDDHTAFAARLQPFATQPMATKTPHTAGAPGEQPVPATANAKASPPAAGAFDHAALVRDLGAKCLQSATKALAGKTGAEFDRCFLQMQIAAHQQSLDQVEVFQAHASPRLRPALAEALPLLTKHRDQAKALHQHCAAAPVDGGGGNR